MANILEIKNLSVKFELADQNLLAVRDVSLNLEKGKALGLVGESGCGKSVTAFSILRLISSPGIIDSGEILYNGKDLLEMSEDDIRSIRGKEIAMIFQEPMSSLNPVFTVGYQIAESLRLHLNETRKNARDMAVDLMKLVGIPSPEKRYNSYPHEFSGGMRQRIMIAIALAASPSVLIADEPTTALDVTIQSQILDLLLKLQEEKGMTLLLITHDLGIVANIADEIAIMYAGEIVESGTTERIFDKPLHPYTKGLFDAIPVIGDKADKLKTISGVVPAVTSSPAGCVFYDRCISRVDKCMETPIGLLEKDSGRKVRCINV